MAQSNLLIATQLIKMIREAIAQSENLPALARLEKANRAGVPSIISAICKTQVEACRLMDQALQISEIQAWVIEQQQE